ncbi:hypothetical protein ENSA5_32560 [Enhygromyxa salina]|uniref:PEGA domain-containing protein n=1 Tax=Enhygromyxa salina TaxID=215803 RepID=A0A2S9XXI8_9BACT|nr:hypothetical protein [Enhygromyxa salina]PRP97563.1 hypothetical protein ENSA5_32560 [Enhygromyxa salina]
MSVTRLITIVALALPCVLAPPSAHAAEECGPRACISGASWSANEQLDDATRRREAKRNRKRPDAQLSVQLDSGRGSVFVDGVWIATAPALYVPIKPGKHDLEVRDGERVLARGVLTIPKKGGEVTVRVL